MSKKALRITLIVLALIVLALCVCVSVYAVPYLGDITGSTLTPTKTGTVAPTRTPHPTGTDFVTPTAVRESTPQSEIFYVTGTPRATRIQPRFATTPRAKPDEPEISLASCIEYLVVEVYLVEIPDEIISTVNACIVAGTGNRGQCEALVLGVLQETARLECLSLGAK